MNSVEDYVAIIEETCGEERHFLAAFKLDKKMRQLRQII